MGRRGASSRRRWRHHATLIEWVLACGLAALLAAPPGAMGEPTAGALVGTMRAARVGEIEIIGVSFATDGEGSSRTPIYSLVFGNPHPAEVRAYDWSSRFGMYGPDATLWTREWPESQARWRRTVLRRPRTLEETATFKRAPEVFRDQGPGGVDLLPHALRDLPDAERAAIDYVVRFGAEGMRVALRVGATADEAAAQLRRVQRAMGVLSSGAPARMQISIRTRNRRSGTS